MSDERPFVEFEPGDRVIMVGDDKSDPVGWIFLILRNGYVTENDWTFHPSTQPATSESFERIKAKRGR